MADEEAQQQKQKAETEVKKFWKDVLPLMQMAVPGSKLHDVARLEYTVNNCILPESFEDSEKKVREHCLMDFIVIQSCFSENLYVNAYTDFLQAEFGTLVFEDVACMVYDLLDSKRLWQNYLENLKLLHIPEFGSPGVSMQTGGQGDHL